MRWIIRVEPAENVELTIIIIFRVAGEICGIVVGVVSVILFEAFCTGHCAATRWRVAAVAVVVVDGVGGLGIGGAHGTTATTLKFKK